MGDNDFSMLNLLRIEVQQQGALLKTALDKMKSTEHDALLLDDAYRAAHALKGAAKLVNVDAIHSLASALELLFQKAVNEGARLSDDHLSLLNLALQQIEEIAELEDDVMQVFDVDQASFIALLAQLDAVEIAADGSEATVENIQKKSVIDSSMLQMFRDEIETHGSVIADCLLILEETPESDATLEKLMRAAHSAKGAARLVGINAIVRIAHVMEDLFVAAQKKQLVLGGDAIDLLLSANDQITAIAALPEAEISAWELEHSPELAQQVNGINSVLKGEKIIAEAAPAAKNRSQIDSSMLDMFRDEVVVHGATIADCLLILEEDPTNAGALEKLMRAAHSTKGAARLVGIDVVVRIAHIMEDLFVAAQSKKLHLSSEAVDVLLAANDQISVISALPEASISSWEENNDKILEQHITALNSALNGNEIRPDQVLASAAVVAPAAQTDHKTHNVSDATKSRVLKVTVDRWDSMMGLAGEIKVEAGWLVPYLNNMMIMRKKQHEMSSLIEGIREFVASEIESPELTAQVSQAHQKVVEFRNIIVDQMNDLDQYERRISNLTERLHRQALSTRMRPFSDGVHGFQRMVRDIARTLKKSVKLELKGETTQVDRDVLEKMEAPLNHIIRNALDHGIELPDERLKAGKPERATITLSACHNEGMLLITVEDNGRGIDVEVLRDKVTQKRLVDQNMAANLSDSELLEFLFLPSFSTRDEVTDLSGRGVGLDVVMDAIQVMRGRVSVETHLGIGSKFLMRLPLTLSVVPGLLVLVAGDYYAFPLSRIVCTAKLHIDAVEIIEGHQYATINGENISLLAASKVFGLKEGAAVRDEQLSIIVITNHNQTYGIVVDKFVDQRELAVQTIDSRLKKVQDISSSALLEDGSTVLIVDVDDVVHTIDLMVQGGRVSNLAMTTRPTEHVIKKTVLIVDDSPTVREVEKKLLEEAGFSVDVAVDGMDGWNAIRTKEYNLIISDIDMPRMNGIELVGMVKSNKQFSQIPVIIISYKDRAEDRQQGMDVGADYYLTKGSFHDDSFINAVHELIGEAEE